MYFKLTSTVIFGLLAVGLLGCTEVDYADVQEQREEVEKERRETEEVKREVAQKIEQQEEEEAAVRRTAMKPVVPEALEEEMKETARIREEGAQRIAEEKRETKEAEEKLAETKDKFQSRQQRDDFLAEADAEVATAKARLDQLEEKASRSEGEAKEELDRRTAQLRERLEAVDDDLEMIRDAELSEWELHREAAENSLAALHADLNDEKAAIKIQVPGVNVEIGRE